MMKLAGHKLLLLVAVLALTVGVVGGCQQGTTIASPGGEPEPADTTPQPTLPPSSAGQTVVADGELSSPYPSLALGFGGGVSGEVLTITVRAGDVVQEGEVLARLDDTELQRAVDDAERALERARLDRERAHAQWERDVANAEEALAGAERSRTAARLQYSSTSVEEAQTALERARQAEANAEEDYNKSLTAWPPMPTDVFYDTWQRAIRERELAEMRLADARDSQNATYLELDSRDADVEQAERSLAALQEGPAPTYDRAVEDAERQLAQAEEALSHARLTAPWDGIVLSVDLAPSATAGPNVPVVTLLNVEDGLRFVTQNLSEQHVARIHPGQQAIVTLRTFSESPLEGTVESVVPQDLPQQGSTTGGRFTVHVQLAPTELRLLPGLTGRVEIRVED
jgi:HlyD family secretion protein